MVGLREADAMLQAMAVIISELQLLRVATCAEHYISPCGLWVWPRPLTGPGSYSSMSWFQWITAVNCGAQLPSAPLGALSAGLVDAVEAWRAKGSQEYHGDDGVCTEAWAVAG